MSEENLNEQQFGRRLGRSSVIKHLQEGGYSVGDYKNGPSVSRQQDAGFVHVWPAYGQSHEELASHLDSHPGMQAQPIVFRGRTPAVFVQFPGNRPNPSQKYYDKRGAKG